MQCACCRLKSTLPELFLPGRIDQQRAGLLCPKCFAELSAERGKWLVQAMCLTVVIGGLLWARGLQHVGLIMASFACGFFFTVLLTPLHELAHAVTAIALGMNVHSIVIGWFGKRLFSFRVGRCVIEVMRVPLGGLTYTSHRGTRCTRLKEFLVVAAGPLLHVVLLVLAGFVVARAGEFGAWSGSVVWLGIVFGMANAFEIALNLWPRRFAVPFGELASDGLLLVRLPFVPDEQLEQWGIGYYYYESLARLRDGDHAGAIECLQEGLARYGGDVCLRSCYATVLLDQGDYDKAARVFEALRERPGLPAETAALLLNNIAWADLASGNSENIPRSLEYSRQAIEALPWSPKVKETRGCALLASGDTEPGMDLLRKAWTENEDARDRALDAAFLALGSARLGRLDEARDWLGKAERLDPQCRQLARARREIEQSASAARAPAQ